MKRRVYIRQILPDRFILDWFIYFINRKINAEVEKKYSFGGGGQDEKVFGYLIGVVGAHS